MPDNQQCKCQTDAKLAHDLQMLKNHRERQARYHRKYYSENKEKCKEYVRNNYEQNKETRRAYGREYYQRKKAERKAIEQAQANLEVQSASTDTDVAVQLGQSSTEQGGVSS